MKTQKYTPAVTDSKRKHIIRGRIKHSIALRTTVRSNGHSVDLRDAISRQYIDNAMTSIPLRQKAYAMIEEIIRSEKFSNWDECVIAIINTLMAYKSKTSDVPPEPPFYAELQFHIDDKFIDNRYVCIINPRERENVQTSYRDGNTFYRKC